MTALPSTPEMYDLRMSEGARPLFDAVVAFIADEVEPHTHEFFRLGKRSGWPAAGSVILQISNRRRGAFTFCWNSIARSMGP